tara:strand:- start:54 stop:206 length:153 start_codon:yes stop_codon:yes gene_type:complete
MTDTPYEISLKALSSDVAKECHPLKNGTTKPEKVANGSNKKNLVAVNLYI